MEVNFQTMNVIKKYREYIEKETGVYEETCNDIVKSDNYISSDELMLRGCNRNNIYHSEKVRGCNYGRKRKY